MKRQRRFFEGQKVDFYLLFGVLSVRLGSPVGGASPGSWYLVVVGPCCWLVFLVLLVLWLSLLLLMCLLWLW